jgi:hypothetical protein
MKDISTDTVCLVVVAFSIRNVNIYCIFTAAIIEMDKPSFFSLICKALEKNGRERERTITDKETDRERERGRERGRGRERDDNKQF